MVHITILRASVAVGSLVLASGCFVEEPAVRRAPAAQHTYVQSGPSQTVVQPAPVQTTTTVTTTQAQPQPAPAVIVR
jgi:hypothetical protein